MLICYEQQQTKPATKQTQKKKVLSCVTVKLLTQFEELIFYISMRRSQNLYYNCNISSVIIDHFVLRSRYIIIVAGMKQIFIIV